MKTQSYSDGNVRETMNSMRLHTTYSSLGQTGEQKPNAKIHTQMDTKIPLNRKNGSVLIKI